MAKLKKPRASFPLTPHASGRGWSKKYRGHQLFIAERVAEAAVEEFNRLARLIDTGQYRPEQKRKAPSRVTVGDVVRRYVEERERDVDAGRLTCGACDDYDDAGNDMVTAFGGDKLVCDLDPDNFTRLYRAWADGDSPLGSHALGRMVQSCRTIFKHAYENAWVESIPRYGSVFRKPAAEKKQGVGFTLEEARALVAAAAASNVQLEAMLLLMLNGGYTAKDCAALPRSAVDFDANIVHFPRPKMKRRRALARVMVLWPETAEALKEVMLRRPKDELVFRTVHGNPWVQGLTDSVRLLCERLQDAMGWDVRGPSWLRHLHRTIADELEKPHAAARLMGHRIPGIAETYIDTIEHCRVEEITLHIRARLWDLPASASARPA
jgi:integrase